MGLKRVAEVKSPLGESLLLQSMVGHEELGRPFRYELLLTTTDPDVDFASVLGQTMTVELERHDGQVREFTGHVIEFSLVGGSGRSVLYRAVLAPWLALLGYGRNCRIFQRQTVPDVIKQVFRKQGFSDFEERLTESYRTWDYLVQYRESDLDFVSRLMEQEGIYHYVKHSGGSHVLVLCDSRSAHETVPGYETIPYFPPEEQRRDRDHIDLWQLTRCIQPGVAVTLDFDFKRPRASLLAQRVEPDEDVGFAYEEFDYPGEYVELAEGEREARLRSEASHAGREVAQASGDTRGLGVGALFTLDGFPRADQNKEYLIAKASYELNVNADESGVAMGPAAYRCRFSVIDGVRAFRAERRTPRPVVDGPQTAIVVGPAGHEIYTDEYGRVKVKFHWDRESAGDENSSCWIRVAQLWAGSGFGGIHIPRIGQEVIVDFLEGDPDRPIITGRVYNFDNQVPYELPLNQTQSGIKSLSTLGGSSTNFNELRFEDKIGSEHVYMQAEKDLGVLVKNEEERSVGAKRTTSIGTDDILEVGEHRSAKVGASDTEEVVASQSVSIGDSQDITVAATRSVTSKQEDISTGSRTKTVDKDESTTVGGSRSETVGKNETISIGKDQIVTVSGKRSHSVDKDDSLQVVGKRIQNIAKEDQLIVGKKLVIDVADELVIKVGQSTLKMQKNGDILLKGKNLKQEGSGKIALNASSDLVLKGSRITDN